MGTVTLSIGPKSYSIACADGEEAHIRKLGGMIAERYAQLGSARAPLEAQNLLFTALFMADELAGAQKRIAGSSPSPPHTVSDEADDLRAEIARLEQALAAARDGPSAPAAPSQHDLFGGSRIWRVAPKPVPPRLKRCLRTPRYASGGTARHEPIEYP